MDEQIREIYMWIADGNKVTVASTCKTWDRISYATSALTQGHYAPQDPKWVRMIRKYMVR